MRRLLLLIFLLFPTTGWTASRYWVGGGATTNWSQTGPTNWGSSSGTRDNVAVPGSGDDVFFDAASGAVTSVINTGFTIKSIDCLGFTGTLTDNAGLTIAGNGVTARLVATMTYNGSFKRFTFTGTSGTTLWYTGGQAIGNTTINGGSGATVQFQDDVNLAGASFVHDIGGLDTNGHALTAGNLSSNITLTRTMTFGASVITLTGNTPIAWNGTNLTVTPGTSKIIVNGTTSAAKSLNWGGKTIYDFEITGTGTGAWTTTGNGGFHNFLVTRAVPKTINIAASSTLTISGSFTSTVNQLTLRSTSSGTAYTINAAVTNIRRVDVKDCTAAGAASRFQDVGGINSTGNTNWDFPVEHVSALVVQ